MGGSSLCGRSAQAPQPHRSRLGWVGNLGPLRSVPYPTAGAAPREPSGEGRRREGHPPLPPSPRPPPLLPPRLRSRGSCCARSAVPGLGLVGEGSESRAREPNGNRRRKTSSPRLPGRCRASGLSRFGGCWSPRGPRRCCLGRAGPGRSAPPPPKTGWLWRSGPPAVTVTRKVCPLKRPGWPRSGPRRT